jgi:ubiquinone/menaquinone biosynthesis C-methylase UbiE
MTTGSAADAAKSGGRLDDTAGRVYTRKLELFNRFAEPELRAALAVLDVQPGQRVLDAGCGTGHITQWLAERAGPAGCAIGVDLSAQHARTARELAPGAAILQADITRLPVPDASLDRLWCANTINHVHDPVATLRLFARALKPGGRLALGQSLFLPEMFFAWNERLERAVVQANRRYYREKYNLKETDTANVRNVLGWVQRAGLREAQARTIMIERTQPLSALDRAYFIECVFEGYWGERVRPYLDADDWRALQDLTDPASAGFCLDRPDFHHLQSYTVVTGVV